jgi:superfamily II DNA or RNA helicase
MLSVGEIGNYYLIKKIKDMEGFLKSIKETLFGSTKNGLSEYQHQSKAIDNTYSYFKKKKNRRANIIMCCGSGKSLTSLWILQKLSKKIKTKHTIIAVPNLILQKQMFDTYYSELSKSHKFICIGSDKEVASDQVDDSIKVTTDRDIVKQFVLNNESKQTLTIVTYQSLNILSEVYGETNHKVDLAIIDEAHKTIGNEDKMFSTILFDENIYIEKRLFMTATKKIYVGDSDKIIGMDNTKYFGDTIYDYPLSTAVKDGVLCDYTVAIPFSVSNDVDDFINNNQYLDLDNIDLSFKEKSTLIASLMSVIVAIREKGCKKVITYHTTIKKAKIFKQLLDKVIENNVLNIGTYHINGNQNGKVKFDTIKAFENSLIGVLTNSKALVEGVDMPSVDCIVFSDIINSPIPIIQAVGRSVRRFEGKKISHIIIPILTKSKADIENIRLSTYRKLYGILISLSVLDDSLLYSIKNANISKPKKKDKLQISYSISIEDGLKDKIISLVGKVNLNIVKRVHRNLLDSKEEHLKFAIENNLTSYTKWSAFDKPNYFYSNPIFKYGSGFFKEVRSVLKDDDLQYNSNEEHIQFAVDNKLISESDWNRFEKPQGYYYSVSKRVRLGKFEKGFFKEVRKRLGLSIKSEEEHIQFAVDNKLTNEKYWKSFKKPQGYYYSVYRRSEKGQFQKDFFNEVKSRLGLIMKSLEEHIEFAVENNLTSRRSWDAFEKPSYFYVEHRRGGEWNSLFKTVKKRLGIKDVVKKSMEEHIEYAVENQLLSVSEWRRTKSKPKEYYSEIRTELKWDGFFEEVKNRVGKLKTN